MKKLKVGIVGCGFIANHRHIPAFLKLKNNVELRAMCDINEALANSVANKFGVSNHYSSLQSMLKNEDLDIIDICTPPGIHMQLAVEAAEFGCHVLMEKPMALKVSDCDLMIKAANKSGVTLSIIHNELFYPVTIKAEKMVEDGQIGKFIGMRWLRLTPRDEYAAISDHWIHKLPGGILGETGPHGIYTSLRFIGKIKNVNILAQKISQYPWLLYDDYRIELEGEKGISSIMISHATDRQAATIELIGTEGLLNLDVFRMILSHHNLNSLNKISLAFSSISTASQIMKSLAYNTASVILGKAKFGHEMLIKNFVQNIMSNQPPPVLPSEGRETVKIINLIIEKLDKQI